MRTCMPGKRLAALWGNGIDGIADICAMLLEALLWARKTDGEKGMANGCEISDLYHYFFRSREWVCVKMSILHAVF